MFVLHGHLAPQETMHIGAGWAAKGDSGFRCDGRHRVRPVSPVYTETGTSLTSAMTYRIGLPPVTATRAPEM